MATGKIVQVIGAVVDVDSLRMPYRACTMLLRCKMVISVSCWKFSSSSAAVSCVPSQSGSSDGLRRGLD